MKRFKKSTVIPIALCIYTAIIALIFYPKQPVGEKTEMLAIIGICYVVILLLWIVLRKKEKIAEKNRSISNEDTSKK
ncbi:MAG: hypothetical protein PHI48_00200 [Bacteroidales bacterium]|nr:hypothetical protein [Bacteroidales bacterium]MDD4820968.1 hypothetical protein [Bacteroidales bacterium]